MFCFLSAWIGLMRNYCRQSALNPCWTDWVLKLSSVPAATTYFLETVLPRFILKLDSSRIVRLEGLQLLESVFVHCIPYLFI